MGLTPRRNQSGETDTNGKISRWGDRLLRPICLRLRQSCFIARKHGYHPLAHPVLLDRLVPARQREFFTVELTHPGPARSRPSHRESRSFLWRPQRRLRHCSPRSWRGPQALFCISLHHLAKGLEVPSRTDQLADTSSSALATGVHCTGVEFVVELFMTLLSFCGIRHPEPTTGSRRATPPSDILAFCGTIPLPSMRRGEIQSGAVGTANYCPEC